MHLFKETTSKLIKPGHAGIISQLLLNIADDVIQKPDTGPYAGGGGLSHPNPSIPHPLGLSPLITKPPFLS